MLRTSAVVCLLLVLPSCIAAIGNTSTSASRVPGGVPVLRARVDLARRVVELRQLRLDDVRTLAAAGRADATSVVEAEIALEEARIRLLEAEAELAAAPRSAEGT